MDPRQGKLLYLHHILISQNASSPNIPLLVHSYASSPNIPLLVHSYASSTDIPTPLPTYYLYLCHILISQNAFSTNIPLLIYFMGLGFRVHALEFGV